MSMRNTSTGSPSRRLLSRTAEHALRAALYLGRQEGVGLVSAAEVARAIGTPPNYTAKTLRQLARKGLLRSVRGPHGGFALRVVVAQISVSRLVDAVEEAPEKQPICLLGDRLCDAEQPCSAHRRWMEVQERSNELMERTTLADLLADEPAPHERAFATTTSEYATSENDMESQ
jgi:Rrf2 family transcriptional regulator, iron-sulfur cluster assembly transcription factor